MKAEDYAAIRRLGTLQTEEGRRTEIERLDAKTRDRLYQHFQGYDPSLFPDGPINCRLIREAQERCK